MIKYKFIFFLFYQITKKEVFMGQYNDNHPKDLSGINGRYKQNITNKNDVILHGENIGSLELIPKYTGETVILFNTDQPKAGFSYTKKSETTVIAGNAEALNQLASYLKENPDIAINLAGHTDTVGSKEYNEELSKRRLEYVKKALEDRGVKPENVTLLTTAEGERNNAVNKGDEAEVQANRRVKVENISYSKVKKNSMYKIFEIEGNVGYPIEIRTELEDPEGMLSRANNYRKNNDMPEVTGNVAEGYASVIISSEAAKPADIKLVAKEGTETNVQFVIKDNSGELRTLNGVILENPAKTQDGMFEMKVYANNSLENGVEKRHIATIKMDNLQQIKNLKVAIYDEDLKFVKEVEKGASGLGSVYMKEALEEAAKLVSAGAFHSDVSGLTNKGVMAKDFDKQNYLS